MAGEYSDEQKDFASKIGKGFNNATAAGEKPKDEKSNALKRRMMALNVPKEE